MRFENYRFIVFIIIVHYTLNVERMKYFLKNNYKSVDTSDFLRKQIFKYHFLFMKEFSKYFDSF